MRHLILILFLLICKLSYGTGQIPDYLIYKGDTLAIFSNPLEKYFEQIGKRELFGFVGCGSTACWRGYKAIWELRNDKLYLKQIVSCHKDCGLELKNADLRKIFGTEVVLAKWFTGKIVAPKGKLIKYIHMGYASLYEQEQIFSIKKGKLITTKTFHNYIDLKNGISRINNDTISTIFYQEISKLNWKELSDRDCDDEYFVTIGKKGNVTKVRFVSYEGNKWNDFWYGISHRKCTRVIKKKLKNLQFDILQRKGKPIKKRYKIELFYDSKLKKLKSFTN